MIRIVKLNVKIGSQIKNLKVQESCTGEGDQKQCKFVCKDFVEKKGKR